MRYDAIELQYTHAARAASPEVSLEACDDADGPPEPASRPVAGIGRFCQLMIGQGSILSPSLMFSDREYALWQLARAGAADDPELRTLAMQLFAWFDQGRRR